MSSEEFRYSPVEFNKRRIEARQAQNVETRRRIIDSLERIRFLAGGHESALPLTNNSHKNYMLDSLSERNDSELGVARAIRFSDGIYVSSRLQIGATALQYDFNLSDQDFNPHSNIRIVRLKGWRLEPKGDRLVRTAPALLVHDHELHIEPTPSIVFETEKLVEKEAASEEPWSHRYSTQELLRTMTKATPSPKYL